MDVFQLLSPNRSKTEFLVFGYNYSLNSSIIPVESALNVGVTFDKNLSFAEHISAKSCFQNIRDLRRIRYTNDQTIDQTCIIVTTSYTTATINTITWVINSAATNYGI